MPYLFTCPHCQTRTQVDDRYSGQQGDCVTCGGEIQLPTFAPQTLLPNPASRGGAKSKRSLGVYISAGTTVFILACVLFAVVQYGGKTISTLNQARVKSTSTKNLEKIASALNEYANAFGSYPPAYTTSGPNNRPMHSWRVLILPYLGYQELYDQFDLSLPWDHPDNFSVSYTMPQEYEHPNVAAAGFSSSTAYFLITGPQTLFPPNGPLGPGDITDNVSQTILVIEANPSSTGSVWVEPIDLDFSKMQGIVGGTQGIEAGGWSEDGAAMVTADGRGHFLSLDTPPSTFNALVTPAGNEPLADDTLD